VSEDIDVRKNISETEDKITVKWKCKRGTGTRDQDEFTVKVRGDKPEEVNGKMIEVMDKVATDQGGLMNSARHIQPSEDLE